MIYPQNIITRGSEQLFEAGVRVLQGNRFAPTELGHLQKLIGYMKLNGERAVADMGCGFGEVSLMMTSAIPRARFWLINQNIYQLARCPMLPEFTLLCQDMCRTSIPQGSVDLVMFNYSLCHVDTSAALEEAAAIARVGGKLFVYDYARTGGDNELAEKHLFAHFISDESFKEACAKTGWTDVETIYPGGDDSPFRAAMADDALYDSIFQHLTPIIWTAKRT
jgi:SAM-dependent methyltransferase